MEMVHECDSCGWTGTEEQLGCVMADMDNIFERLDPGCVVPSGDCPECQACCYPLDAAHYRNAAAADLLDALKSIVEAADHPDNEKDNDFVEDLNWEAIRQAVSKAEGVV